MFFHITSKPTTYIYTLSLHDALPISIAMTVRPAASFSSAFWICFSDSVSSDEVASSSKRMGAFFKSARAMARRCCWRSEEHTSELQSRENLVCRLLLEKKKKNTEIKF